MHDIDLILTLSGGLIAALCFGYLTHLLRLSPIVGYLLAGVAIGPYTPGFIANQGLAEQLAEIGVVLLMFGVGLHFHLKDLLAVRKIAIPGAVVQSAVATVLGALLFRSLGWSWEAGIVYGLCLAVASTVVLTRVLVDNRELQTPTGHVAIGWLIVEDLFTVFILVVLPIVFGTAAEEHSLVYAAGLAALKIGALVAAVFLLGGKVIPRIFTRAAKSSSHELFTLTVLATVMGIAVGSAKLFDVSMALGAFLAGMVVGRSEFSARAAAEALPMRDAFAVLFFVSVGMLLDPATLLANWPILLGTLGVVMIGKSLAAFSIVLLLGYPVRVALGVSAALSQVGEFSFILANLGLSLGILDEVATNTMVAAAIISITLNPLIYRTVPAVDRWIGRHEKLLAFLTSRMRSRFPQEAPEHEAASAISAAQRAVIIGYGPTGRTVLRLLREAGIEPTIIELNIETSRELMQQGVPAIYGDARRRETLERAGVEMSGALVISATNIADSEEIVRIAKEINPSIRVLARTAYIRDTERLRAAGCEAVFSGEAEVAFALIQQVLQLYGVTLEELQREKIRMDLAHAKA